MTYRPPAFAVPLPPLCGAPALGVLVAACASLVACSSPGGSSSADLSDPALAALAECVEARPDEVWPRPLIEAAGVEVLVDTTYWEQACGARTEVFLDAVGLCGWASAAGVHVGSDAGVAAVRAAYAREHGRVAPAGELDLGVCHDVLLTLGRALEGGAPDLGDRLTEDEARWTINRATNKAHLTRERERIDARRDERRRGDRLPSRPSAPRAPSAEGERETVVPETVVLD